MKKAAEDFVNKYLEEFEKEVMGLVDDWKTRKILDGLEVLLQSYKGHKPEWVTSFANIAKEFYQSQPLKDTIKKYEDSDPEFFNQMFHEYILTLTALNSEVRTQDLSLTLKLAEEDPILIKWEGTAIGNNYIGSRLKSRIIDHFGIEPSQEKTENLIISDFRVFAKAIHYSMPLKYKPLISNFRLHIGSEGLVVTNIYEE